MSDGGLAARNFRPHPKKGESEPNTVRGPGRPRLLDDDDEMLQATLKTTAARDEYAVGLGNGRVSLRRAQLKRALAGNPTMLIWLGKQMLGHRVGGCVATHFFHLSSASGDAFNSCFANRQVGRALSRTAVNRSLCRRSVR